MCQRPLNCWHANVIYCIRDDHDLLEKKVRISCSRPPEVVLYLTATHTGSTVWCLEESSKTGRGGPSTTERRRGRVKKTTTTTIPSLSFLDVPSKQRLVIKLTSQQASALAFASWSIVVHWGGNSSFQGIPGQKAEMTSTHRSSPGTEEWEQSACHCVVTGQPFNPGQPWSTETDLLFLSFFDVAPLSCHTQREGEEEEGGRRRACRPSQGPPHPLLHISLQHD